jgi:cytoskeletal protein CcmA (bactofilin family)
VSASTAAAAAGMSRSGGTTIIGSTMNIKGSLQSSENVDLNGQFEGQMDVKARLFIGPQAKAAANLKVAELNVAGAVQGNVDATGRVTLRTGANLVGDVKTPGIVIEDGAFFKGGIDIMRVPAPDKNAADKNG